MTCYADTYALEPTLEQIILISGCVRETANGPYYDDVEFHTLFSMTREEMRDAAQRPDAREVGIAVLNNMLGYPHGDRVRAEFLSKVGCSEAEAQAALDKLLSWDAKL